jgi:nitrite reductase/ring-hydroxylating ferredoxin subunit
VNPSSLVLRDPANTPNVREAIINQGEFFRLSEAHLPAGSHLRVREAILQGIRSLAGEAVYQEAATQGLERLHTYYPIERVGQLKRHVVEQLRSSLLDWTAKIGRQHLGLNGEFYVDLNTILRINYPFAAARKAPRTSEDPSVGSGRQPKLTLLQKVTTHKRVVATRAHLRQLLGGHRAHEVSKTWARDANYDLATYHQNLPPAAWAHGPHIDTWYGHAFEGINIWWAIDGVVRENSMVLYPQSFGQDVQPDPRSMYIKAGTPLSEPANLELAPGDMLLFNPEILHATHLNIADKTRIAITARINPGIPHFDPRAPYARTHWLQASDIEAGKDTCVKVFPRELHLRVANKTPTALGEVRTFELPGSLSESKVRVCLSSDIPVGGLARVKIGETRLLLLRGQNTLRAVASRCPHLGLDMADGYRTDSTLHCPGHGLVFDLATGESQCNDFRLRVFAAEDSEGAVHVWRQPRPDNSKL